MIATINRISHARNRLSRGEFGLSSVFRWFEFLARMVIGDFETSLAHLKAVVTIVLKWPYRVILKFV